MHRKLAVWMLSMGLPWVGLHPAIAQDDLFDDDDDFLFDDEPSSEAPQDREEGPDDPPQDPLESDEDDLVFEDEVTEEGEIGGDDLFEGEEAGADASRVTGRDSVEMYRAKQREVRGSAADEEIMAWEAYLEAYPNALYRERIEARVQELLDEQYRQATLGGDLDPRDPSRAEQDLKRQEILLVSPVALPNLNPRSRVLVGGLIGVPVAGGAWADFEYAPLRQLSVHGGLWGRGTGWGLEVGVRGSPVKSARDQFLFTPALDFRLNFGPLLFSVRPQVGVGAIVAKNLHLLGNVGTEITAQANATVGVFGGIHLSYRVAPPVAVYVESDMYARQLARADGSFVFGSVGLGLRFYPQLKNREGEDALEIMAGGYARTASRYFEPWQGAAAVQGAYYLK